MKCIRIGFIGTGFQGRDLIRRLAEKESYVKVTAVSDIDRESAQETADLYGLKVYATGQELIASQEVDAVAVTSWGETHEEYVLQAIAHNKPVFCEKPLATTREGCMKIVKAELDAGKKYVQVGFMRRFDRRYQDLKKVLDSKEAGNILLMHCAHRNKEVGATYTSDMVVTDMMVHEIDIVRWLTGKEIMAVQILKPKSSIHANQNTNFPLYGIFELEDGTIVDVEANAAAYFGYEVTCEVVGENAVVSLPQMNPVTVKAKNKKEEFLPSLWTERFDQAYEDEILAWAESLKKGKADGPDSFDGYMAAVCTDACLQSLHEGGRILTDKMERPNLFIK